MQIKLVAILLAPLFARQGGWRKAWVGASVTALPFLPYAADVGNWLAGVGHFGSHLGFNGSTPFPRWHPVAVPLLWHCARRFLFCGSG